MTFGLVCVLTAHYNPHGGTFAESSFPWFKASPAVGGFCNESHDAVPVPSPKRPLDRFDARTVVA